MSFDLDDQARERAYGTYKEEVMEARAAFLKVIDKNRNNVDIAKIKQSLDFAEKHHLNQKRDSGEPYILHPIAVASIINGLHLDTISIVAAVLHDTIEDTDATLQDINKLFPKEVGVLVSGVTKLNKISFRSIHAKQAENFRKMLMVISDDIRALLVKLADRLHNMRTLRFMKDADKRKQKAQETMEIYAPLAERLGIYNIKNELQDLAFAELHSDAREAIIQKTNEQYADVRAIMPAIQEEIVSKIKKYNINATVQSREKTSCAIWYKMQQKDINFEDFSDIIAFRIVTKTIRECYLVLGILHESYAMVPDTFKDYISTPKINGYRSLHTVIVGPNNHRMEIQIRDEEMHAISEHGIAGHWSYKQPSEFGSGTEWRGVREVLDILKDTSHNPEELLENTKKQLGYDQVFCFTPKGEVVALLKGATVVDFAFALHERVGAFCEGAKINGTSAPISTVISNGDRIEVLLSSRPKASEEMEKHAVTGKAKAAIRKFIRKRHKEECSLLGKRVLKNHAKREGLKFNEDDVSKGVLQDLKCKNLTGIFVALAKGKLHPEKVFHFISKHNEDKRILYLNPFKMLYHKIVQFIRYHQWEISISGLSEGISIHTQDCCNPEKGDLIVGTIIREMGMEVHLKDCEQFHDKCKKLPRSRFFPLSWYKDKGRYGSSGSYNEEEIACIRVTISHKIGSLSAMANIIEKHSINIANLEQIEHSKGSFTFEIDLVLNNNQDVKPIIADLNASPAIMKVAQQ